MPHSEYKTSTPEAFRGFIEGVQNLQDYLQSNNGEKLDNAERLLSESLAFDPAFAPAQYYKAIVLTHGRKPDDAITLLEGLNRDNSPYKAEVLYNLAFAHARKYQYESFKRALELLDEAQRSASWRLMGLSLKTERPDLLLLIKAMRAWVMAAFAGREYGKKQDFEKRQRELLPECIALAKSVLTDPRRESFPLESQIAIEVEAHNAAGIAYMRMGQRFQLFEEGKAGSSSWFGRKSDLLGKSAENYWKLADENFTAALRVHPADVRVLDNVETLNLIQACYAMINGDEEAARSFSETAKKTAQTAISHNPHDRFRHYNLAKALALLGDWDAAGQAIQDLIAEPRGVLTNEQAEQFRREVIEAENKRPVVAQYFPLEDETTVAVT